MRIKRKKNIAIVLIILATLVPGVCLSQEWGGTKPINFWDHWSVNINAGYTSYFGDLSYYDSEIVNKLKLESGPGFGFMITKYVNDKIGISGQILYGNLKGGDNKRVSFTTHMIEYNLNASIDFIRLFNPDRNPKFGLEGFVGLGHIWFSTEMYQLGDDSPKKRTYQTGVPEFVFFGGAGAHYHISEKIALTTSLSLRHIQNDKLDNLVKNGDNDFFSYLSVGITYYINSIGSKPLKNKARVAHSSRRSR